MITSGGAEALDPARGDQEVVATAAAGDSVRIAGWTLVSRLTGVLRVAAIGAVLGPTLLGNTFQFANSLPNLVYYGFLAGSLFSSLLVPCLVPALDGGDRRTAEQIAGGFLGVALAALVVAGFAVVLVGPLLLRVGLLGTEAAALGDTQERVGRLLVFLLVPQVLLYVVVGSATAVMNAQRRFALAAAAPALENLGMLVVLGLAALLYGTTSHLDVVPESELVLLGAGATGAVVLHAAVQWWGARRAGVTLVPRAGWRNPEVVALVRRAMPALGLAGLAALQLLAVLVLANRVAGGVVAMQMGLTFYYFVVALGATPVALSFLPRLARLHADGDTSGFGQVWTRGMALVLFVTVPAAMGYVLLARPLAETIAIGRMGSDTGVHLVAVTIATLALGVVGEGLFQVLTYTSYARKDSRTPLSSMGVQVLVFLVLASSAFLVEGAAVLTVLGLSFSIANCVGAGHLALRLRRRTGTAQGQLGSTVARVVGGAALMAPPVWVLTQLIPRWLDGRVGWAATVLTATALGATVFLLLQVWWRSPELAWVTGGLGRVRGRDREGGP
ncbi:murein biosynthesis integral membrane protein MurJ [Geodermatophilus sp. SYSU D00705]